MGFARSSYQALRFASYVLSEQAFDRYQWEKATFICYLRPGYIRGLTARSKTPTLTSEGLRCHLPILVNKGGDAGRDNNQRVLLALLISNAGPCVGSGDRRVGNGGLARLL